MDIATAISLTITIVGGAIATTRFVHAQIAAAHHDADRRLDKIDTDLCQLRADLRVFQERTEGQLSRLDAWQRNLEDRLLSTKQDMAAGDRHLADSINSIRRQIADIELFLVKNFSYAIRRNRED